ncbi:phosphatidylinositol/phosphatidylcholine transfer protein Sec14p [Spathaspora passalidarum NRRL Y-27907]|uniref:Phosphatidylinositol/phosphatidylcholine transfer protein Sec14p n=1 Tax=Spathaspora passalidarum (strain NRRL Y-27907 / 11-Y1) TaxID=619300 RepID=G3ANF5_SPAPN|nr:phosphatidylinositol/phosphatidylcholine transfer protein Sec14p [Spathaspora passalidarum NRRL Y-27907]EGW31944.1 phosphatidylinositol/phosphatidylcholine transfer protein Sec14p [Spathaspora passalidarum NRRL Y-27907]
MTTISEEEILASYPQVNAPTDQTGYTSNLTEEQKQLVIDLRKRLQELGYKSRLDDASMLRFLRARKFDLEKSLEMFVNCEKWREEFGVNTILQDFHYQEKPIVASMYPQYYHKTDKDGRPVYFEELGKVDLYQMLKITTQERMLKNLVWEYESMVQYRLPACSRQAGYLVETSCTILDLKGISVSSAYSVIGYVREASKIGQDYYPERMGKFYLINAPFGFATAFKLFKPFLDPVTVSKIFILSSSYQKELLKQIPPQNLPTKFGGLSQVTDQELLLNDVGPWRDPKYIGPEGEAPRSFQT